MLFALFFFLNAAANFALGVALSALLGPAEFGRYATAFLGATTLATALFDWLRLSSIRFSAADERRVPVASSLDAAWLTMIAFALVLTLGLAAGGADFGFGLALLALTPFLAIAVARADYSSATMRARNLTRAFLNFTLVRQGLTFTVVLGVTWWTRSAFASLAALIVVTLAATLLAAAPIRTPGARVSLAEREDVRRFLVYAKPIVVSTVLYQAMALVNRHLALEWFGPEATGKLALATDLGFRVFLALNVLPETLLFQYALRREAQEGRAAAERQIGVNTALVFALLAPLAVGYATMSPTFEALLVPQAYRGDYARLSLWLTPGFFAFCALYSACNPVFQLEKTTWPLTLAATAAIVCDLALVTIAPFNASIDGLAQAHAISLVVGFLCAAIPAWRRKAMRPRLRDLAVVAGASAAMGAGLSQLNGIAPPALVAALGVLLGGGSTLAVFVALDVGGLKAWTREKFACGGACAAPPA